LLATHGPAQSAASRQSLEHGSPAIASGDRSGIEHAYESVSAGACLSLLTDDPFGLSTG